MPRDLSNPIPRSLISKGLFFNTHASSYGSRALGILLRFDLLICIVIVNIGLQHLVAPGNKRLHMYNVTLLFNVKLLVK